MKNLTLEAVVQSFARAPTLIKMSFICKTEGFELAMPSFCPPIVIITNYLIIPLALYTSDVLTGRVYF